METRKVSSWSVLKSLEEHSPRRHRYQQFELYVQVQGQEQFLQLVQTSSRIFQFPCPRPCLGRL